MVGIEDDAGAVIAGGSVRDAEAYLAQREDVKQQVVVASYALRRRFAEAFPDAPAYLVFRPGARVRLTWRKRGGDKAFIKLDGEIGQALLRELPLSARRTFLDFDAERDELAARFHILSTETYVLRQWIKRRRERQRIRKSMLSQT